MPTERRFASFPAFDEGAVAEVMAGWREVYPQCGVLALVPEAERAAIPALQTLSSSLDVPLVGAMFPAVVVEGRFQREGLVLMRLDPMPAYVLAEGLAVTGPELRPRAQALAGSIAPRLPREEGTTLFLLFDALVPKIATLLETLYLELSDRVDYLGVNAGSETFQPEPCLFDNTRWVQGGALALALEHEAVTALEHGFAAPEEMVAATSTEGNRIVSIDWRPAFDVYRERVRAQYGVEITKDNFYTYAVHFPFGIMRASGEVLVRIPVALEEDGSLFCVGEVPENAVLTLLEAPGAEQGEAVRAISRHIGTGGGDILTFYCAGRCMHLADAAADELEALSEASGHAALYGALSLGEIGRSCEGGYPVFHNACIVCARS
jgi:hypothetical protein